MMVHHVIKPKTARFVMHNRGTNIVAAKFASGPIGSKETVIPVEVGVKNLTRAVFEPLTC